MGNEKQAEAECEYYWDIKDASTNDKAGIVCHDCYGEIIVKVQLSIAGDYSEVEAMIYNADHSVFYMGPPDKELLEAMGEEKKKFFFFEIIDGKKIKLLQEAPQQDW